MRRLRTIIRIAYRKKRINAELKGWQHGVMNKGLIFRMNGNDLLF